MIIAADIGGTKTNVALFEAGRDSTSLSTLIQSSYRSASASGLSEILEQFFIDTGRYRPEDVKAACFGVAGPIIERRSSIPNLSWSIDGPELQRQFGFPTMTLLNDLEATAMGIPALGSDQLATLNAGKASEKRQTSAVLAAGTGLGTAILVPDDDDWMAVASEGGHSDLAPRNEVEIEFLRYLMQRYDRVSVERIVSGPGLINAYKFFLRRDGDDADPILKSKVKDEPVTAPGAISEAGLNKKCPVAARALQLFVDMYGAAAGNLALYTLAFGGVYVAGGIAPKILPALTDGRFMEAFSFKGRLTPVLKDIPVHVVMNPETALLGAARYALRKAGEFPR